MTKLNMIPLHQAQDCSIGRLNEQQSWKGKCEKSAGRAKLERAGKSEGKRQE